MVNDFNRIFITGDIHGDLRDLSTRCRNAGLKRDDLVILLGDNAFEFDSFYEEKGMLSLQDLQNQTNAFQYIAPQILCIQGNHETPFNEMHGKRGVLFGGKVISSNGILFAENGSVLTINGKKFLCIGGAFSVDKKYRVENNIPYWEHEELTPEEMEVILKNVKGKKFDYVLTHTCPFDEMPKEALFKFENKIVFENRTEHFLQTIKESIKYDQWYCGHFHINKVLGKTHFLSNEICELDLDKKHIKTEEKSK